MATERRYLKGDHIRCMEFPNYDLVFLWYWVKQQDAATGIVLCEIDPDCGPKADIPRTQKFYAHQVQLMKRPWWNWLRLPFCEVVLNYDRTKAK